MAENNNAQITAELIENLGEKQVMPTSFTEHATAIRESVEWLCRELDRQRAVLRTGQDPIDGGFVILDWAVPKGFYNAEKRERERLEVQVAEYESKLAELQATLKGFENLKMLSCSAEPGRLDIQMRSDVVHIIAGCLAEEFIDRGGVNYVELEVNNEKTGPLTLLMQKRFGKTPAVVARESQDAMKAIIDKMRDALATGGLEYNGPQWRWFIAGLIDEFDGKGSCPAGDTPDEEPAEATAGAAL